MASSIRGDGLWTAQAALAALVKHPERLDRDRERFSASPPSYRSRGSQYSTLSQSPNQLSEERRCHQERQWQRKEEYRASMAGAQFYAQKREEWQRIKGAIDNRARQIRIPIPNNKDFSQLADENVKQR